MSKSARLTLIGAFVLFAVFFSNVTFGALGNKPILSDLQEMLTLLCAAILFSISVLCFEAVEANKHS